MGQRQALSHLTDCGHITPQQVNFNYLGVSSAAPLGAGTRTGVRDAWELTAVGALDLPLSLDRGTRLSTRSTDLFWTF